MESEISLPCPLVPILSHMNAVHLPPYLFKILFNILPSMPRTSKPVPSVQVFQPKLCMNFSYFPYVLHVAPITCFFISSSGEKYKLSSALCYSIFSSLLSLPPFWLQILSSTSLLKHPQSKSCSSPYTEINCNILY